MSTTPAEHLTCVRLNLLDARTAARNASHALPPGSRRNRATQLAEKITDALAFCERLQMVVEGDQRAEVNR
ncbi:hypothetical protein [Mycobacterium haemophilum]|uniref:Uncharacterized protein n=1 Tax=Mycobacterium haemophilum TaxID=29311 RepID=A0A0I9U1K8_9MYCO|nr:hypothetical protein [Mycobacterium haemophilum]KLO29518.1 hypothetical protein ABH39_12050 [Mycobacterium haemophilum]KLO35969.1 hypothetical protein ABH38_13890 [Mycobacterium haemophilum]KLO41528.1 hypothetical protein ABH37_13190 [Mycobacterium haemophilum]KLO49407.1 hypothetical protein ABH36_12450 [Mycobacterium haemophilum]